jgi:hypothetical protein
MTPEELRFIPQPSVKWMSPRTLADTAGRMGLARVLGAYLDKREFLGLNEQSVFDHSKKDELWIDYVADLGDGFDSTYSIAYLLSQAQLDVDDEQLGRGSVLVMGGDQVYPSANWREYANRLWGPYLAANPVRHSSLYAVPGNHDWYDGLSAFGRQFMEKRSIGGFRTTQTRSYFALRLPHNWWLLAIDAQFDAHLDRPQLDYFAEAAADMRPGDRVILCVPQPSWVWTEFDRRSFDRVDQFIQEIVTPRGADVPLILTGDRHHYAHYAEIGGNRHLITAGGGGGYLSPTHNLPERITAPPRSALSHADSPPRDYQLAHTYPTKSRSWRYSFGILGRLPWLNKGFILFMGVLMLLATVSILEGAGPLVGAASLLVAAGIAFAHPSAGRRRLKHYALGIAHGGAQLGLAWLGAQALKSLPWSGVWAFVAYMPVAGLCATWLVGLYLLIANRVGVNANELFAGLSIVDSKCFLRMRVSAEGVTVYPIGLDRSGRKWRADPDGKPEASWIQPVKPLHPHLIEAPFTVPHVGPPTTEMPKQRGLRKLVAQASNWFGMSS